MKELLDVLNEISPNLDPDEKYWFRGQSDTSYKLIPTVFRKNESGQFYNEAKLLKEFVRHNPEARALHSDTLELLTYAQHYGLPTRLLDWSTNLLVAIFFACNADFDKDANLYIYKLTDDLEKTEKRKNLYEQFVNCENYARCLKIIHAEVKSLSERDNRFFLINSKPLNEFVFDDFMLNYGLYKQMEINIAEREFEGDDYYDESNIFSSAIPYEPMLANERIKRQQGCFTLHGGKIFDDMQSLPVVAMDEETYSNFNDWSHRIVKQKILAKDKKEILRQLMMLGITNHTLFPEIEHQTRYLKNLCINPKSFNHENF